MVYLSKSVKTSYITLVVTQLFKNQREKRGTIKCLIYYISNKILPHLRSNYLAQEINQYLFKVCHGKIVIGLEMEKYFRPDCALYQLTFLIHFDRSFIARPKRLFSLSRKLNFYVINANISFHHPASQAFPFPNNTGTFSFI